MKKIKREHIKIFLIILGIIIILIPFIPYKLPATLINYEGNYIDISTNQSTGGYHVLSGSEKIEEYKKTVGNPNLKTNEVYQSTFGKDNDQFSKINFYVCKDFRLYGKFIGYEKDNVPVFEIEKWRPLNHTIHMWDTRFWHKISVPSLVLYCLFLILMRKFTFKLPTTLNILMIIYIFIFYLIFAWLQSSTNIF